MSETVVFDWRTILAAWKYAHGKPDLFAQIKSEPEDFQVDENLGFVPEGNGEHIWLHLKKRKQNTDMVAKALAKHAGVAYRDVGYSGLKDHQAITSQWFSIYKPGGDSIDWNAFDLSGVEIETIQRHNRKLRRGTHKSNTFAIRLRDVSGDLEGFSERINTIQESGVPNYFGEQRFGRSLNNLTQIHDAFAQHRRIKNRHLRSLLYSSARSWLFNCIVSKRIENGTWNSLYQSEPANLNGSNSVFLSENNKTEESRLKQLDIHPTAPMWGKSEPGRVFSYQALDSFERDQISAYATLVSGLEKAGVDYQRRPIRMQVDNLSWQHDETSIYLKFDLAKGQYATSVLRELVLIP